MHQIPTRTNAHRRGLSLVGEQATTARPSQPRQQIGEAATCRLVSVLRYNCSCVVDFHRSDCLYSTIVPVHYYTRTIVHNNTGVRLPVQCYGIFRTGLERVDRPSSILDTTSAVITYHGSTTTTITTTTTTVVAVVALLAIHIWISLSLSLLWWCWFVIHMGRPTQMPSQ